MRVTERRIRRALGSSDEEEEDDEEGDSEAEEIGWGKRKTNFYGADNIVSSNSWQC